MEHKALYREYRPKTFDEVIGQKHVIDALQNSVKNDRVAHAYLFCGTRGTGKTSAAKILSRAVNCLSPENGNPCNKCAICTAILSESLLDVIEIDAASNNSVDNVRDIREEVVYLPAEARYKVYIIDEVHMLSTGAFNALLKTLEEPPSHVIFILATTEPGKLPSTILSRCQRYDFKRIAFDDILGKITKVCSELGIDAEPEALALISRTADGALRDALSILDKCISVSDMKLTYQNVLSLANITDIDLLRDIVIAMAESNSREIIQRIDDYEKNGLDYKFFIAEMLEFLRNLLVCTLVKDPSRLILADVQTISQMQEIAASIGKEQITRYINRLGELNKDIKYVHKPKVFVELALLELSGGLKAFPKSSPVIKNESVETVKNDLKTQNSELDRLWEQTIQNMQENGNIAVSMYLKGTILKEIDERYKIIFDPTDAQKKKIVEKSENIEKIKSFLLKLLDRDDIILSCELRDETSGKDKVPGFSESGIEALFEGVPIDIIEG